MREEEDGMQQAGLAPTLAEKREYAHQDRTVAVAAKKIRELGDKVDALKAENVKIEKALADACSSMEAAVRIMSDRKRSHDYRLYEALAYLTSRIEVAHEFMDQTLIETVPRPVCPVTHKECSAAEPCHAPACGLAVL